MTIPDARQAKVNDLFILPQYNSDSHCGIKRIVYIIKSPILYYINFRVFAPNDGIGRDKSEFESSKEKAIVITKEPGIEVVINSEILIELVVIQMAADFAGMIRTVIFHRVTWGMTGSMMLWSGMRMRLRCRGMLGLDSGAQNH